MDGRALSPAAALRWIRAIHTAVWALLVACIAGIPVAAAQDRFGIAATLVAVVLGECVVLAANGGRCPLTDLAARHTPDRAPNFDIWLPAWLARHNKAIFGGLFVAGSAYAVARWLAGAP